jgi:hypothetical protein
MSSGVVELELLVRQAASVAEVVRRRIRVGTGRLQQVLQEQRRQVLRREPVVQVKFLHRVTVVALLLFQVELEAVG